ncbi:MAG TPA: hypothetical protein H9792_01425 [Candidatus Limosilactobacillus excrementigallinarum]|nr:hypothetical protein [Candidatus Limosilactobacillus excrementigallinarum]
MTFEEVQRAMDNDWLVAYKGKPALVIESNTVNKTFLVTTLNGKRCTVKADELERTEDE